MTTAAAEVTSTPEEQIASPAEAEQQIAPPPEISGEQPTTPETPAPVAEAAAPAEFNLESSPEWQEFQGAPVEAPNPTPAELPGTSLEDVAQATYTRLGTEYAGFMQSFEGNAIQPFLRDELGLAPNEAQQVYEKVRPWLAHQHARNEAYNLTVTDQVIRSLLTPEEVKEYESRSYLVKDNAGNIQPLNSRATAFKAVLALREKSARAETEEKLKSGELVTKADLAAQIKKAGVVAETAFQRFLEENDRLKGTSSMKTVNGDAGGSSGPASLAEAEQMHAGMHPSGKTFTNAEMRAWRVSHGY